MTKQHGLAPTIFLSARWMERPHPAEFLVAHTPPHGKTGLGNPWTPRKHPRIFVSLLPRSQEPLTTSRGVTNPVGHRPLKTSHAPHPPTPPPSPLGPLPRGVLYLGYGVYWVDDIYYIWCTISGTLYRVYFRYPPLPLDILPEVRQRPTEGTSTRLPCSYGSTVGGRPSGASATIRRHHSVSTAPVGPRPRIGGPKD